MKAVLLAVTLLFPFRGAAESHHRRCEERDDCNRKETCFMFCNDIIIIPNPVPGGQQPSGIACLVPFPYHCDPKPKGLM